MLDQTFVIVLVLACRAVVQRRLVFAIDQRNPSQIEHEYDYEKKTAPDWTLKIE